MGWKSESVNNGFIAQRPALGECMYVIKENHPYPINVGQVLASELVLVGEPEGKRIKVRTTLVDGEFVVELDSVCQPITIE